MKYILCLIAGFFLMSPVLSRAQESLSTPANRYQIAIHPTYIYVNGIRVDFEKRLNSKGNWLMFSLAGFYVNDYFTSLFESYDYKYIAGGMGELTYKHFIAYPDIRFLFVAAGVSFSYYRVNYEDYSFQPFYEDGMKFYEPKWMEIYHDIPKFGSHISLGFQVPARSRVFVDGTVGLGYSYSFNNKEKHIPNDFDFLYGLSRRGIYPTATFRIGVRLGKL